MFGRVSLLFALAVTITSTPGASAQAPTVTGVNAWSSNIRASDEGLNALVTEGIKRSPTLKTMADRLTKSDVIVYVRTDVAARGNSQGRLSFISATGGYRYLAIYIPSTTQSKQQQLAILGHELQHAVEIADAPTVVDSITLKREFERIGTVSQTQTGRGTSMSFDSPAAVEARRRILREIDGS